MPGTWALSSNAGGNCRKTPYRHRVAALASSRRAKRAAQFTGPDGEFHIGIWKSQTKNWMF
jgi:hypothetical protein